MTAKLAIEEATLSHAGAQMSCRQFVFLPNMSAYHP